MSKATVDAAAYIAPEQLTRKKAGGYTGVVDLCVLRRVP